MSETDKGAPSRPPEPAHEGRAHVSSSPWAQVCLCQEGRVGPGGQALSREARGLRREGGAVKCEPCWLAPSSEREWCLSLDSPGLRASQHSPARLSSGIRRSVPLRPQLGPRRLLGRHSWAQSTQLCLGGLDRSPTLPPTPHQVRQRRPFSSCLGSRIAWLGQGLGEGSVEPESMPAQSPQRPGVLCLPFFPPQELVSGDLSPSHEAGPLGHRPLGSLGGTSLAGQDRPAPGGRRGLAGPAEVGELRATAPPKELVHRQVCCKCVCARECLHVHVGECRVTGMHLPLLPAFLSCGRASSPGRKLRSPVLALKPGSAVTLPPC